MPGYITGHLGVVDATLAVMVLATVSFCDPAILGCWKALDIDGVAPLIPVLGGLHPTAMESSGDAPLLLLHNGRNCPFSSIHPSLIATLVLPTPVLAVQTGLHHASCQFA